MGIAMSLSPNPLIRVKVLRLLAMAILASLLFIGASLPPLSVQGQISLPEALQQRPTTDAIQVGNLDIGKVRLDGTVLFQVAAPTSDAKSGTSSTTPIERRVKTIQFHLADIVNDGFDPDTLKITPSILNHQTILVASDKSWGPRNILTVTAFDLELDEPGTIESVAQRWAKVIQQALLTAREQRQLPYLTQQIPPVLVIVTVIVTASFLMDRLQKNRGVRRRKFEQRRRELDQTEAKTDSSLSSLPSEHEPTSPLSAQHRLSLSRHLPHFTLDQKIEINLIFRQVFVAAQFVIWFGGIALMFQRFAQTRAFAGWLMRFPFVLMGIPIGITVFKSLVDAWIRLYVISRCDRIREGGGGDIRLEPRARTIVIVLQELNGYVAVVLGLLSFFYLIEALNIGLIILAAITFLSQDVLKDLAKTYFILIEDQYALGDWIQIGTLDGEVEKISLRNTQLRSACGDLHTLSHGNLAEVTNYTHQYSGYNLWIDVAYSTHLDQAMVVMKQVAQDLQADLSWGAYLTAAEMRGVEKFGDNSITLRLVLKTPPGQQWYVAREYRRRLKSAFDQAGITIPFPQRSIWFENTVPNNPSISENQTH